MYCNHIVLVFRLSEQKLSQKSYHSSYRGRLSLNRLLVADCGRVVRGNAVVFHVFQELLWHLCENLFSQGCRPLYDGTS